MANGFMQACGGSSKLEMYSNSYTGTGGKGRTYGSIADTKSTLPKDVALVMSATTDSGSYYSRIYFQGSNNQTDWVDILSGNTSEVVNEVVNTAYRYVRCAHEASGTYGQKGTSLIVIAV